MKLLTRINLWIFLVLCLFISVFFICFLFQISFSFQVFFAVFIGAFSLGMAAPNLQHFATARGAAHIVYQLIDQVGVPMNVYLHTLE